MTHRFLILGLIGLAACKTTIENTAPTAVATGPESVDAGAWVQLDGSDSSDAEDDDLNASWSFVQLPIGSAASLNDDGVENPSFRADVPGSYVVRLVVDDGFLRSEPATVTVEALAVNTRPIAELGLDRNVVTGNAVLLDGAASYDPDGDTVSYAWDFVEKPSGSVAVFDDASSAAPSFTADLDGNYTVRLVVSDGTADSEPDIAVINASADNLAPIANAGVDQSVAVGTQVDLDGSGSLDPNGSDLTYAWTFTQRPDGSTSAITQDGTAAANFTPDVEGSYTVALVVDDGTVSSAPDDLQIQAFIENTPPVADAGTDGAGLVGTSVQLDGSASFDDDGDLLSFVWQFTALPLGSTATLNDPNVVRPTFTPDVETDSNDADDVYELRLQVWDGVFWSAPATVQFTVGAGNTPPVADAGSDVTNAATGSVIQLDGSASADADGDPLSYVWRFTKAPDGFFGGLNDASVVNPSFVASVDAGVADPYELELTVWDGTAWSLPSTVTIQSSGGNLAPDAEILGTGACVVDTAAATDTCSVDAGVVVQLDGSNSGDANGDDIAYEWAFTAQPAGSATLFNDTALLDPSFVPDVDGDYVVRLRTYDGALWSAPVSVTVTAGNANQPPIADAGDDLVDNTGSAGSDDRVTTGSPVQLDGTESEDPEDESLTYQWTFHSIPQGSSTQLNDTSVESPSFTPDVDGEYVAKLVVSDGVLWSTPAFVTIGSKDGNGAPTACAFDDPNIVACASGPAPPGPVADGDTVQLDGSESSDPDGDDLFFEWAFVALPAGSTAVLNNANVENPSFEADEEGDYTARVRVSDGAARSAWSYVTITAQ